MALITRVTRLFRADLHAVLDRIEEPDVLLRQAVREMEEEVAADEQRMQLLRHEQQQHITRQAEMERALREIDGELDLCFEADKEDLARPLVRRKLELSQYKQSLAQSKQRADQALSALEKRLKENRGQLQSMRQKVELLAADNKTEPTTQGLSEPQFCVRDEEVEVALLREKQHRSKS
jgi:phage shock protein A